MSLEALGVLVGSATCALDRKVLAQFLSFWNSLMDEERGCLMSTLARDEVRVAMSSLTCAPEPDLVAIQRILEATSANGNGKAAELATIKDQEAVPEAPNVRKGSNSEAIRQFIKSLPKGSVISIDDILNGCRTKKPLTRVLISWVLKELRVACVVRHAKGRGRGMYYVL